MEKVIGKVWETTDYGKFRFVEGNRTVNTKTQKFKELLESIDTNGQLEPAIVSKAHEVINGQHRLVACQMLGIPFRYTFGSGGATVDSIADANRSQAWGYKEYIHYYASQTDERANNYKYFNALVQEFKIPISSMLAIVGDQWKGLSQDITSGRLKLSAGRYVTIRNCLSELRDLGYMRWAKEAHVTSRPYWQAVCYAYRHPKVKMDRLIKCIYENEHRIPSSSRVPDLLRVYSEIYNKRLHKDRKVYLDQDHEQGKYREWESL